MSLIKRGTPMLPVPTLPPPGEDPGAGVDSSPARWAAYFSQLYADLTQSLRGIALQGALPVPIGYDDAGRELGQNGSQQISRSAGRLLGWSIQETTGTAVNLTFYDIDEPLAANASHGSPVAVTSLTGHGHENEQVVPTSFVDGLAVTFTGGGFVYGVVLLSGVDG